MTSQTSSFSKPEMVYKMKSTTCIDRKNKKWESTKRIWQVAYMAADKEYMVHRDTKEITTIWQSSPCYIGKTSKCEDQRMQAMVTSIIHMANELCWDNKHTTEMLNWEEWNL